MKIRRVVALAAIAALGCTDSPTPPVVGFNGALVFSFTGGGGGSFNANGDVFLAADAGTLQTSDWAFGVRDNANIRFGVIANAPASLATHNRVFLVINSVNVGSSSVAASCDPEGEDSCTGVVVYIGQSNTFSTYEFFCTLTTGTVAITAIDNDRAEGTFSGSGLCFDSDGNDEPFTLTGGSFDVALIAEGNVPSL